MKLLLDTHVLLWALATPERLSQKTRSLVADARHGVFVSSASSWEIEIKRAMGKLRAPTDLERQLKDRRLVELPVRVRHVEALRDLPPLHRDPFDRMLVAQALVDDLTLVSADEQLLAYPVRSLRP